jgi:SAM-dependent methyltransferase
MHAVPFRTRLGNLWQSVRDPRGRAELLWRRLPRPPGVFQISGNTAEDRFPAVFGFVRHELADRPSLRLLSFGCSTGEEVFSLRRYFPLAAIDGIDINPYRIRTCRRRLLERGGDAAVRFMVAGSTKRLTKSSYDAIFCLSVLRHGGLSEGRAARCDHLIEFAAAERVVGDFARCLKPGGFLAIVNSNFRFADMAVAASFDVAMQTDDERPRPRTPLYGPDNRLLVGASYRDVVFRKHAATGGR